MVGAESSHWELKSVHDHGLSAVLPHFDGRGLVRWSERSKRTPTCVRQIRDLLTHVVQPAEGDSTPQCVCGSIRQASFIASSRLYAV